MKMVRERHTKRDELVPVPGRQAHSGILVGMGNVNRMILDHGGMVIYVGEGEGS